MMMPWSMPPWAPMMQVHAHTFFPRRSPLMAVPGGGFPVPESLRWRQLPPAVQASVMRLMEGPPKPAVTLAVMNEAQATMIAPDLPNRSDI